MNNGRQRNGKGNFYTDRESEALNVWMKETELFIAKGEPENPTGTERLMEAVCEIENFGTPVFAGSVPPGIPEFPAELKSHSRFPCARGHRDE